MVTVMEKENYEMMSAHTVVVVWHDKTLTVYHEALLPLYLHRIHNAGLWLQTRAIDSHCAPRKITNLTFRIDFGKAHCNFYSALFLFQCPIAPDTFAQHTNVDAKTRMISYDIREVGEKFP